MARTKENFYITLRIQGERRNNVFGKVWARKEENSLFFPSYPTHEVVLVLYYVWVCWQVVDTFFLYKVSGPQVDCWTDKLNWLDK